MSDCVFYDKKKYARTPSRHIWQSRQRVGNRLKLENILVTSTDACPLCIGCQVLRNLTKGTLGKRTEKHGPKWLVNNNFQFFETQTLAVLTIFGAFLHNIATKALRKGRARTCGPKCWIGAHNKTVTSIDGSSVKTYILPHLSYYPFREN